MKPSRTSPSLRRPLVEPLERRQLLTTLPSGFAETLVTEGITGPTAMAVAPDGRIFVAEQAGRLRVIKDGRLLSSPFVTIDAQLRGERGLIGVVLDPDFSTNGYVYVYHTPSSSNANRITRYTASGDVAAAGSGKLIFQLDAPGGEASIHQGGAMHFGRDGKLYLAVGDHGNRTRAQQLTNQNGKILRLNKDGSIPSDNPFYNQSVGKNRAIWALGLRNPYTFAIQPTTGRMLINDVGEDTWEEINEGRAGANYGWPETEGVTSDARFTSPMHVYSHANGKAIVGGTFYHPRAGASASFPSSFAGDYFFMDFDHAYIKRLDNGAAGAAQSFASGLVGKVVDLDVGADGSLYYLSRGRTGVSAAGVYRIRHTGNLAPTISAHPLSRTVSVGQSVTFTVSATGAGTLRYQWLRDGVAIGGATGASYTLASATPADNGVKFRALVSNGSGSATSNGARLTVTSNRTPVATITSPASGTLYSGGSVINFAGTATDPEDGTLAAGAFTWLVEFHHDDHAHPFLGPISNAKAGSFTVPRAGELSANVWYRIHLTVRDSKGLTHTTSRDVKPVKATITLASNVPGLKLALDGSPVTALKTVTGVAGITRSLGAPATQSLNGTMYEFVSWSDGGARTHNVSFPTSNKTYTANFRAVSGTTTRTLSSVADSYVNDDGTGAGSHGSTGELFVRSSAPGGLNRHAYYKFDLTSLGNIASAKLRLFGRLLSDVATDSVTTSVFAAADIPWEEASLVWANRPASGTPALASARVTAGALQWYEWDLTNYLRQQKAAGKTSVTLVIKNLTLTKASAGFRSKEATSNKPQLVVTG